MEKLKQWLFVALIILMPSTTNAAGLKEIAVLSTLGQPFHAEIDLVVFQKEELASLSAQLAPRGTYQQAGLDYNPTAATLKLEIQKRANGALHQD